MGSSTTIARGTPSKVAACRLLVHPEEGLVATLQFVIAGLEAGQQVFAMAGPARLKELAHCLGQGGLRPETLLHNRRLVFLTAPDCVSRFLKQGDPFRRGSLLRNGSLLRWVSDWSWACPSRSDCTRSTSRNPRRSLTVRLHERFLALQAARERENTPGFKTQYFSI